MTAPLRSTPHASALPASQTAPVAEFRCLFTHDVRRKQKRWQDGYLKFHTFNNRVMVSDEARNHIGDTYWKESDELHEGDELSLDKGVLVEVAEAMGITQTDLAPIIAKKTKEAPKEAAGTTRPTPSSTVKPFQRLTSVAPSTGARAASQLRHKSLNTLLGTPRGPVGKAVPIQSPYEARKEKENEERPVQERAPKRQKVHQRPTGRRASSPVHIDDPSLVKPPPAWAKPTDIKARHTPSVLRTQPTKTITISSEADPLPPASSEVTLPGTPARVREPATPQSLTTSTSMPRPGVLSEPVSARTPRPQLAKARRPKKMTTETPKRPAPNSSPPVSASNRLTNISFALQTVQEPPKVPSPSRSPQPKAKAKSLRLSAGVKRATLLCQSMPRRSSTAGSEPRASRPRPVASEPSRLADQDPSPIILEIDEEDVCHDIRPHSRTSPAPKRKQKSNNLGMSKSKKVKKKTPPLESQEETLDDAELMYGLMDQQLLVLSSPETTPHPRVSSPMSVPPLNTKTKGQISTLPMATSVNLNTSEPVQTVPKRAQKGQTSRKASPVAVTVHAIPPRTVFDHPAPRFKEISQPRNQASDTGLRVASTSPQKLPLSTGGFQRRSKSSSSRTKNSNNIENPDPAPAPRPETVALPPHPLRAGKQGPMMSTTELASVLSKSRKRAPVDDPIEDDGTLPTKSPARKIRRVRSENDAPIPSAAQAWEQRNLPKGSSTLMEPDAEGEIVAPPEPKKKVSALAALVKRTDPRKKFQRTQSLNVDTTVLGMVEPELPSPVVDKDVGPWSTEAFDLFDWRPPTREDDGG